MGDQHNGSSFSAPSGPGADPSITFSTSGTSFPLPSTVSFSPAQLKGGFSAAIAFSGIARRRSLPTATPSRSTRAVTTGRTSSGQRLELGGKRLPQIPAVPEAGTTALQGVGTTTRRENQHKPRVSRYGHSRGSWSPSPSASRAKPPPPPPTHPGSPTTISPRPKKKEDQS